MDWNDAWDKAQYIPGVATGAALFDPTGNSRRAVNKAQGQYKDLGSEMWNHSVWAGQQAMNPWNIAEGQFGNRYAPGMDANRYGEDAWENYGYQLKSAPQLQGLVNQLGNKYQGTTLSQQNYNGASNALRRPSASEGNLGWTNENLGAYTNSDRALYGANQELGSSAIGNWWNQNSGQFDAPGAAEKTFASSSGDYAGLSNDLGRANTRADNEIGAVNYNKDALARIGNSLASARNYLGSDINRGDLEVGNTGALADRSGRIENYYGRANDLQGFAARQGRQYEAPGALEQFQSQYAATGSNPYLDRIQSKGLATINQEMARRGHFRSGGADTAIGNYLGEMGAQNFKYAGDLAGQAQNAKFSRLGAGGQLAQGVSGEKITQGRSLQDLGAQLSGEQLNRGAYNLNKAQTRANALNQFMNTDLAAAQAASSEGMSKAVQRRAGAENVARTRLDATNALMNAANMSQGANQNRLINAMTGAKSASENALARRQELRLGSNAADESLRANAAERRLASGLSDQTRRSNWEALGQMAQSSDSANTARDTLLVNATQNLDAETRARANDYLRGAHAAQALKEGRLAQELQMRMGISAQQAAIIQDSYAKALGYYSDANSAAINAGVNAGQLRDAGNQAVFNNGMRLASLAMGGGGMGGMGGAGGAAGYTPSSYAPQTIPIPNATPIPPKTYSV